MNTVKKWKVAEELFRQLCVESDAVCTKPETDERGWDFLVEFPDGKHVGPAESAPSSPKVFVQVKSTERNIPQFRLKLTNARHAANSPHAWFIILVQFERNTIAPRRYSVLHIWENEIRRILKALRVAHVRSERLNKKYINFRLTDENEVQSNHLLLRIQESVANTKGNYETRKEELFSNVGYEDGYGNISVSITAENQDELSRNVLGLGDGLKATAFQYVPQRFGVKDLQASQIHGSGVLKINPKPQGECKVHIGGIDRGREVILPASFYSAPGFGPSPRDFPIRISSELLEIYGTSRGKFSIELTLNEAKVISVELLHTFVAMMAVQGDRVFPIHFTVGGKLLTAGTLRIDPTPASEGFSRIEKVTSFIRSVCDVDDVDLSLDQLLRSFGELDLIRRCGESDLSHISISPTSEVHPWECVTYYLFAPFGEWAVGVFYESKIVCAEKVDERVVLSLARPSVFHGMVLKEEVEIFKTTMEKTYERLRANRDGLYEISIGDVRACME